MLSEEVLNKNLYIFVCRPFQQRHYHSTLRYICTCHPEITLKSHQIIILQGQIKKALPAEAKDIGLYLKPVCLEIWACIPRHSYCIWLGIWQRIIFILFPILYLISRHQITLKSQFSVYFLNFNAIVLVVRLVNT